MPGFICDYAMRFFLLTITIFLFHSSNAQQKFTQVKVGENISLKIPVDFVDMGFSDRVRKYISVREPLAMFTSQSRDAGLGINQNIMYWTTKDTQTVYGFYKASVQALFDDVQFIQDTIRQINGREFIVFEFVSSLGDDNAFYTRKPEKNYTYIQYTSYNDQVLLFNFGCERRFQNRWEMIARQIMESIKIN